MFYKIFIGISQHPTYVISIFEGMLAFEKHKNETEPSPQDCVSEIECPRAATALLRFFLTSVRNGFCDSAYISKELFQNGKIVETKPASKEMV